MEGGTGTGVVVCGSANGDTQMVGGGRWCVAVGGGRARYVGSVVLGDMYDVVKRLGGETAASNLGVLVEGWLGCCCCLSSHEPSGGDPRDA